MPLRRPRGDRRARQREHRPPPAARRLRATTVAFSVTHAYSNPNSNPSPNPNPNPNPNPSPSPNPNPNPDPNPSPSPSPNPNQLTHAYDRVASLPALATDPMITSGRSLVRAGLTSGASGRRALGWGDGQGWGDNQRSEVRVTLAVGRAYRVHPLGPALAPLGRCRDAAVDLQPAGYHPARRGRRRHGRGRWRGGRGRWGGDQHSCGRGRGPCAA